jgi:hypothetical protein
MYREVSKLILYRDLGEDSILLKLADIFKRFDSCHYRADELITDIYKEMKALLDLATTYGFDKNLWHNYLTFVLVTNENSFSMTSEKVGANNGTVNHFAKNDFQVFMNLFHYDFRAIEETLGIDCFRTILDYKAIGKTERMYNKNVSEKVRALSDELAAAEDVDTFFDAVVKFYKDYGDGNVSSSWDKVTIFYNKQGEKLFKFGLAYDNVQLLVRDVKNTQRSISNQKKKK